MHRSAALPIRPIRRRRVMHSDNGSENAHYELSGKRIRAIVARHF